MRLTYRAVTLDDDLDGCFRRLGDSFAYDPTVRPHVARIWRHLLAQNALAATLFEDYERPPEQRILGLVATVFVSDAFMTEVRSWAQPYLRARVIHQVLAGRSPVLSLVHAQRANDAEGVRVFFLNDPLSNRTLNEDVLQCVYEKWREVLLGFRACRLKELSWECYGEQRYRWASQRCGLWLRTDWADVWQNQGTEAPPPDERPYLMGATPEETLALRGTLTASLFAYMALT